LIPSVIRANFDVAFSCDGGADVPAGYTPKYVLGGAASLKKDGTVAGEQITFALTASETSTFTTGQYWYQVVAENGTGNRVFIAEGTVYVNATPAGTGIFDGRSIYEKILDAIDATIQGKATSDQQSYVIQSGSGSRSLSRMSMTDLLEARKLYASLVAQQKRAESGAPIFKTHKFQFTKP
jgi:hypothetical protein